MILDDATEKSREGEQQRRQSGLKSGGRGSGSKKFDFYRQISEQFQFFQAILQKNIQFCKQICEHFDFFQAIKKIRFSKQKIFHLQATSGQIILFLFKSNHFRTYFLHMIRYNNISRPVHDSNEPLRPPLRPTCPKSWVATLSPWIVMGKKPFPGGKKLPRGGLRRMKMPQEKNGENTDLKCDLVLCRNKDYAKEGHHKIGIKPLK